jgi:hypothetical protein
MLTGDNVNYTASWTQICNRALGRLGAMSIADLMEGTQNAEFCVRFLPEAIEYVLGQYDFNFARDRVLLAPNAEAPVFGWRARFNLPADLIRLVKVYGGPGETADGEEDGGIPYQVENGGILANADELRIIYIARPKDPNRLPPPVRKAISTHLAYLLATPLTSNEQLISLIAAESQSALELAKKEDARMNYDPRAAGERFYTEARR